jgi:hypothetical protein
MIMEALIHTVTKDMSMARKTHSDYLGLISETDFIHHELHGFEVDLTGNVVIPELRPKSDVVIRLHHCVPNGHQAVEQILIM